MGARVVGLAAGLLLIGMLSCAPGAADPIDELLNRDAPPRDWREELRQNPRALQQPPLTSSDDDMLGYWLWAGERSPPDAPTQRRLIECIEHVPSRFGGLAELLSADTAETTEPLKRLFDRLVTAETAEEHSVAEELRDWLILNSDYFVEDLVATALGTRNGSPDAQTRALARLATLHPRVAVERLPQRVDGQSTDQHARALGALLQMSENVVDPTAVALWREKLKAIAADPAESNDSRHIAITEVMRSAGDEHAEWFLALFRSGIKAARDKYMHEENPVSGPVIAAPDYWIPKVASLLRQADPVVRSNAAGCLLHFQNENARRDALLPLLPWVANPKWVQTRDKLGRLRLLQSLTSIDIPECAPLLSRSIAHDRNAELAASAEAAARYRVNAAIPMLRAALLRARDAQYRRKVVQALLTLGGLSADEMAKGVRDYAIAVAALPEEEWTGQAWEQISKKPHDPGLAIGYELTTHAPADERTAALVRRELAKLPKNSRAAGILSDALAQWPTASSYVESLARLRSGDYTASWLATLLAAKTEFPRILHDADGLSGAAAGIQAALTRDPLQIERVFSASERDAKRALLAGARLIRLALPIDQVAPLLEDEDKAVASAADRYLATLDTPEARAALQLRARGEARILGYPGDIAGAAAEGPVERAEQQLRQRFLEPDAPSEIYALLSSGGWGDEGQRALLIYKDRAVIQSDDGNGRSRRAEISIRDIEALRGWLGANRAGELPPYDEGASDGIQLQYVHLTRMEESVST